MNTTPDPVRSKIAINAMPELRPSLTSNGFGNQRLPYSGVTFQQHTLGGSGEASKLGPLGILQRIVKEAPPEDSQPQADSQERKCKGEKQYSRDLLPYSGKTGLLRGHVERHSHIILPWTTILELGQGDIVFGHTHFLQLCLAAWDSGLYVIMDKCLSASIGKINPTLTAVSPCDLRSEAREYRP
ncbi:MAG: hypothetical protein FRX49_09874 [Trebouxia sp. A1-2]|nr:MAG: hypothetical protein FRX49_09874 [Trebouxia sp. A1-2]